jgi:hypothetical protein
MHRSHTFVACAGLVLGTLVLPASLTREVAAAPAPAGTAFTYQGQLNNGGGPYNGLASFQFRLFNAVAAGSQVGTTVTVCDVPVTNGLFSLTLDFGANPFDGSDRWLEIGAQTAAGNCSTFTTLSPRQAVNATPYAIRSLAPWAPNGSSIFYNGGRVGIGVTAPTADLDIVNDDATLRLLSDSITGTSSLTLQGAPPSGFSANVLGVLNFSDGAATPYASISSVKGLLGNALNFNIGATTEMMIDIAGEVGIGTTTPSAKLHIQGGTDSALTGGGFIITGATNGLNLSIDDNEIMARSNGAASTLTLNNDGGNVSICPQGIGRTGIGTAPTGAAVLTVYDSLWINGTQPRLDIGPDGFILMDDGADITITNGGLEVNTPSAGSTFFNRTATDGSLINFKNNGVTAGNISVFGSTVSYNTFTGSHHAWTDVPVAHGALVRLTGSNHKAHAGPNCEPVYGIETTTRANDPSAMGAYLAPPDASDPDSHHLVAAVGNGEMWVVDSGRGDLAPGDFLISSDVEGCAMLDDTERFTVGHVVARVAEPIRWADVKASPDGLRRALVSIFYENFERQGDAARTAAAIDELRDANATLRAENAELRARLESIERMMRGIAAQSGGGRP